MIRLLDQGLPVTAAAILREQGWDAVRVREIKMHEASDAEILESAVRESRVLITLDRDFPQMLALTGALRPSVVLLRQQRLRAKDVVRVVSSIWLDHENELAQGCVLKVSARGTRTRLLPLK